MASGGYFSLEDIPYFNGRLFNDNTVLELDSDGLDSLAGGKLALDQQMS